MMAVRMMGLAGPLPVGFGGAVARERIVAVGRAESAPIQRAMRQAEADDLLVDLTFGRRVRAVLFMDSGHVVRVAVSPETLQGRWAVPVADGSMKEVG